MPSGYAYLAIFCIVFGFMYAPPLAAFIGGVLSLILAAILFVCRFLVRRKPYNKTHMWLMLEKDKRPPSEIAQRLVSGALDASYKWFAKTAVLFSGIFLALSIFFNTVGFDSFPDTPAPVVRDMPIPSILIMPDGPDLARHLSHP